MKQSDEILDDIRSRFSERTGKTFQYGSVLDLFSSAVSSSLEEVYQEIENNKNPHIWTKLEGDTLDATGIWVNCPREAGENDTSYRYRLMNWMLRNEAGNTTAIQDSLLNMEYASNAEFVPMTKGCGTGTVYVIPKAYNSVAISAALSEARERVAKYASPALYIEYVIPEIRAVSIEAYLKTDAGDETAIKNQIDSAIRRYVNTIAPKSYLSVGAMNKLGININDVDYFNVVGLIVDGVVISKVKLLQELDSKFLFDQITWIGDSDDANA